jgi:hypothetical protein
MSKNFDLDRYLFKSAVVTPPDNLFGTAPNNPSILYINQIKRVTSTLLRGSLPTPLPWKQKPFITIMTSFFFLRIRPFKQGELGGIVELYLGNEMESLEKVIIDESTIIFVKAGMLHCPLRFVEIYNKEKPIIFQDITLCGQYSKFKRAARRDLMWMETDR